MPAKKKSEKLLQVSMKKELLIFTILGAIGAVFYFRSFAVFFTQDDFILTTQFSAGNFKQDLANSFLAPVVTHFRPLHNLYFLTAGNVFNNNPFGYHLITYLIYVGSIYLVFKAVGKIGFDTKSAFLSSVIFATSPIHFIAINWLSGNALLIGFFLYVLGFYLLKRGNLFPGAAFSFISLLASEALAPVVIATFAVNLISGKLKKEGKISLIIIAAALIYTAVKFIFLTPKNTYLAYKVGFNFDSIKALYFYTTKILGFSGTGNDLLPSTILIILLTYCAYRFIKNAKRSKKLLLAFSIAVAGLIPFILIPQHLSPHYAVISLFGVALLWANVFENTNTRISFALITLWIIASFINVQILYKDNWVLKRSMIAKNYLKQIERENFPEGKMLIFDDNKLSSSKEAYISLGEGKAINFYFKDKSYKTCFTFIQQCPEDEGQIFH